MRVELQKIVGMYLSGMTSEQIGASIGTTGRAVRYRLETAGLASMMTERRRTASVGKSPPNKGVLRTRNPRLGRYYVTRHGRTLPRARAVMEDIVGRALSRAEVVHHIDGNPLNDDPGNLELLPSQSAHMRLHHHSRAVPQDNEVLS
jgi:hypothetical protein